MDRNIITEADVEPRKWWSLGCDRIRCDSKYESPDGPHLPAGLRAQAARYGWRTEPRDKPADALDAVADVCPLHARELSPLDLTDRAWTLCTEAAVRQRWPWVHSPHATIRGHYGTYVVYTASAADGSDRECVILRIDVEPHRVVYMTQQSGYSAGAVTVAVAHIAERERDERWPIIGYPYGEAPGIDDAP